jgi:glycosyltransferase involved in cell wall biosynthesis
MARKKFLIATENLGRSAPGIVFERLISEIARRHDVDVVCLIDQSSTDLRHVANISEVRPDHCDLWSDPIMKSRISKYSLKLFGDDFAARLAAAAMAKVVDQRTAGCAPYDYAFAMVSFKHLSPLILCERLTRLRLAKKNIAYFVDAIPAPPGWSVNTREFRSLRTYIRARLEKIDGLFSSNEQMLRYQLAIARDIAIDHVGVLLTPTSGADWPLPATTGQERYNFLYTGGFYGKRTPKYVLSALKLVLERHPNAYLVFVGTTAFESNELSMLTESERKHVLIHPFTTDLTRFYAEATALLDIDGDLDDDVFLSSKIANYLSVNRIIISETGRNSPARNLFRSARESVLQCFHDPHEIAERMCDAIRSNATVDFSDRAELIARFSAPSVVDSLELALGIQ